MELLRDSANLEVDPDDISPRQFRQVRGWLAIKHLF